MSLQSGIGMLALVLGSASAGWLLHGLARPPQAEPAATAAAEPADAASRGSLLAFPQVTGSGAAPDAGAPEVELHADGSASIRVQHRPPAWVLAELCRQGARGLPGCGPSATAQAQPAAPVAALTPAPELAPPDVSRLLPRLRDPAESVRYQALMHARAEGLMLPEGTLRSLMETDSSERVRIEAYEAWVEAHSGTDDDLRAALNTVLRIPQPALQARAREQLDDLEESLRQDAASAQQPPRF
ncbi:hypothetical protein [Azohydromonas aeria]|uniref:hypothetical protein n=1 Tax=Azohydromonas aeria TaxID=2590212 RepID=UPI0012FB24A6|nr:hypothetical protein [Azohydromonas aeria]